MIVILTAQHTGTWFVIYFIEKALNEQVILFKDLLFQNKPETNILHCHIAPTIEGIHPNDKLKHITPILLNSFVSAYKTIITVRDPVLSIITRQNRHPDFDHTYIIDAFGWMAELYFRKLPHVFFLPVDLFNNFAPRLSLLKSLCKFIGADANSGFVREYATSWILKNSTRDISGFKAKYLFGDFDAIKHKFPKEINALSTNLLIQKFMEDLGYRKLIWFKK